MGKKKPQKRSPNALEVRVSEAGLKLMASTLFAIASFALGQWSAQGSQDRLRPIEYPEKSPCQILQNRIPQ